MPSREGRAAVYQRSPEMAFPVSGPAEQKTEQARHHRLLPWRTSLCDSEADALRANRQASTARDQVRQRSHGRGTHPCFTSLLPAPQAQDALGKDAGLGMTGS